MQWQATQAPLHKLVLRRNWPLHSAATMQAGSLAQELETALAQLQYVSELAEARQVQLAAADPEPWRIAAVGPGRRTQRR